jgi:hypothetical protein
MFKKRKVEADEEEAKHVDVAETSDTSDILFYTDLPDFPEFSNFHPCKVVYRKKVYPSSEHAYQAHKFEQNDHPLAPTYAELIRNASTPNKARILALMDIQSGYPWRLALNKIMHPFKDAGLKRRPDWDEVKDDVMREILASKFTQHASLKALLLKTGTRKIVEHTSRDSYWADGGDGSGQNRLGTLLMDLRTEFQSDLSAKKLKVEEEKRPRPLNEYVLPDCIGAFKTSFPQDVVDGFLDVWCAKRKWPQVRSYCMEQKIEDRAKELVKKLEKQKKEKGETKEQRDARLDMAHVQRFFGFLKTELALKQEGDPFL